MSAPDCDAGGAQRSPRAHHHSVAVGVLLQHVQRLAAGEPETPPLPDGEQVVPAVAAEHRPGSRVDRVKLRYRSKPIPARLVGEPSPGRHPRLELELGDAAEGVAPGQLACLMDGELVVGWGTIARH